MRMRIAERVLIDVDRCIECKACFAACYYGHRYEPIVTYGITGQVQFPLICRQCDEPTCVEACPYSAMCRDEHGIVRRSLPLCRGCGSCAAACPFGTITAKLYQHQAPKCDMCEDQVLEGRLPRCVAVCPAGALQFVQIDEIELERKGLYAIGGRVLGRDLLKRR